MIAKLTGTLDSAGRDSAVIDVGGVGYLVRCSARTLRALPPIGQAARVVVETIVREDRFDLYGFADAAERDWFRLLTSVQGVGAKVALAVLSALSPADLGRALAAQDKAVLTRAEGVGPKLANRIASELKDKVAALGIEPEAFAAPAGGIAVDAVSALVNLGYRRAEAQEAVAAAAARLGGAVSLEALIRAGLKGLAA